ncbi:MAG: zinc ribbon domain-containing protein [Actinomycetota bacterium]|nr:zinc ribbon domain-containing protein [Actinomycetota bacterium]
MTRCASCGAALPPQAVFCGNCGFRNGPPPVLDPADLFTPLPSAAPAPTAVEEFVPTVPLIRRNPALVIVGALAVLGSAVLAFVLFSGGDESSTTSPSAGTTTTVPASTTTESTTTTTTAPATTTTALPEDPAARLQLLVDNDRAAAVTLVDKYVVQLSAKRVGLEVDGRVFALPDIYDDHLLFREPYGAILVDASTFQFAAGGKPMTGWYLTIVPTPFDTKAAAEAWCASKSLSSTDCFSRVFMPPV